MMPSEHKNLPRQAHPVTNHPQFSYKKNKLDNGHKKKSNSKSKSGRKFISGGKKSSVNSNFQNTASNGSNQFEMR